VESLPGKQHTKFPSVIEHATAAPVPPSLEQNGHDTHTQVESCRLQVGGTSFDYSPACIGGELRDEERYVAWFHELDAWTEYWDIYHPETRGRFYFGDTGSETGLLTKFLPRERRPPAFISWCHMATGCGTRDDFTREVLVPEVAAAVMEVDGLVGRLFDKYFGDAADLSVQADYLEAMFRFGADLLPAATDREALIPDNDPRKRTAGRHALDGDIMWFAWALELEAAYAIAGADRDQARRALQLAGVAIGCPANFAWRGHRYTRPEYAADEATATVLRQHGQGWALDFEAAADEIHTLYRIREWGHE
jgi:hypothetical protein